MVSRLETGLVERASILVLHLWLRTRYILSVLHLALLLSLCSINSLQVPVRSFGSMQRQMEPDALLLVQCMELIHGVCPSSFSIIPLWVSCSSSALYHQDCG